ncbi:hypothetical protein B0H10DRAFT_1827868, partial [Mycena sp. CBHHK59/15]
SEPCAHCSAKRAPGDRPLCLCSGCKSLRFCCREHQVAFWPEHKTFCKLQQEWRGRNLGIEKVHRHDNLGLPSLQDRMRWVEDWVELHRHSLEEARAWAVHASDPPMNFRTHYFRFRLKYRPESEGNPSTAFTLESAQVCVHPPPSSERAALDMVMSMIETAVA